MGYDTNFEGAFDISPPLSSDQVKYLKALAGTRRVTRSQIDGLADPLREAVGLEPGPDGCFFTGHVDETGTSYFKDGPGVVNGNSPPADQPGLWLNWIATNDGTKMQWNGSEKSYHMAEWVLWLVSNIFKPWGRRLLGVVHWTGGDMYSAGTILIKDPESMTAESVNQLSVEALQTALATSGTDYSHCVEKDEMEALLLSKPTAAQSVWQGGVRVKLENSFHCQNSFHQTVTQITAALAAGAPAADEDQQVENYVLSGAKPPNYRRTMTLDQKRMVSANFRKLSDEKLIAAVDIIRENMPTTAGDEGDIVIDIDSLDNKALWDLYDYIESALAHGGKTKRQKISP